LEHGKAHDCEITVKDSQLGGKKYGLTPKMPCFLVIVKPLMVQK